MSATSDVRSASDAFYAALNRMGNGAKGAMEGVWSHGTQVTAMHPIGGRTEGWETVRQSFDQVAGMATNDRIGIRDQQMTIGGMNGSPGSTELAIIRPGRGIRPQPSPPPQLVERRHDGQRGAQRGAWRLAVSLRGQRRELGGEKRQDGEFRHKPPADNALILSRPPDLEGNDPIAVRCYGCLLSRGQISPASS